MGAVEQVARGAPSTLLAVVLWAGSSAAGGITQLVGCAWRAAFDGVVGAAAHGTADSALGAPPVAAEGVHAETKPASMPMAKGARARNDRITMVRGDATRIPLAGASVDAVTIGFGIRNVERMDAACAELHRVLKPDGRLAILEFAEPTVLVFGALYRWYVRRILPRIGRALSRNDVAYSYLPASIAAFATPEEFVKILRQAGFDTISPTRLALGSVILYTARKGLGAGG